MHKILGGEIIDYVTEEDKKAKKEVKKEETAVEAVEEVIEAVEEVIEAAEEVVETAEEVVEAAEEVEDLSAKTLTELKAMAKTAGIKGYSTMKKDELISSLSE